MSEPVQMSKLPEPDKLKELLRMMGLTTREIADRIDASASAVSNVINRKVRHKAPEYSEEMKAKVLAAVQKEHRSWLKRIDSQFRQI